MDESDQKYSDRLFWMVQTVFGVVLGSGLVLHRQVLLHPFDEKNWVAISMLLLIYTTTVWSWMDFSYTSVLNPYSPQQTLERVRVLSDLFIVILYSVLWFSVEAVAGNPTHSLSQLLLGYVAIFVLYLISGYLRILQHGPKASRVKLMWLFLVLHAAVWVIYQRLYPQFSGVGLNLVTLSVLAGLVVLYRTCRRRLASKTRWIGIDVDGVLADQVSPLLPIIKRQLGIELNYEDVKQWDLPVSTTNIAKLIEERHGDEDYVRSLPMHRGAAEIVRNLSKQHRIAVITSRSEKSDVWTKKWLEANQIPFDRFINTKEKHNTTFPVSVLIDDYLRNVTKFLHNTEGRVILFDQPWNRDRDELQKYLADGRLVIVRNWQEVASSLAALLDGKRS